MVNRLGPALAFGTALYLLVLVASGVLHGAAGIDGLWLSRRLPPAVTAVLGAVVGAGLLLHALGFLRSSTSRSIVAGTLCAGALWALGDAISFVRLVRAGAVTPGLPLPASAVVCGLFAMLAALVFRGQSGVASEQSRTPLLLGLLVPLAAPFLQFATFGTTRYERPSDVALVMGAGVFPGGRVSHAAASRVEEAVRLYERGLVKRVVMLAGDDNEGSGMAAHAVAQGVPAAAVSYRADCVNTERAAALSAETLGATGEQALVVSHYYHLPRIRLLYAREGAHVRTVPAVMERRLLMEPYYPLREVASTYHELVFRSKVGPVLKRYLAERASRRTTPS